MTPEAFAVACQAFITSGALETLARQLELDAFNAFLNGTAADDENRRQRHLGHMEVCQIIKNATQG